jgi:putative colanic acid biosysnthesis UDP-glucose lipid carrier transferase
MSQPVLLKASLPVALVTLLQTVLPALAVGAMLWLVAKVHLQPFDRMYVALALVATALSLAMFRPPQQDTPRLALQLAGLAINFVVRWAIVVLLLYLIGVASGFDEHYSRPVILWWALLAGGAVFLLQLALLLVMRRIVMDQSNQRSAVIVGANAVSLRLAGTLEDHRELCTWVAGFFDDRSADRLEPLGKFKLLGKLADLVGYVKREKIDVIFVALPIRHVQRVMDLLDDLRDSTASIYYVPDIFVFDLIQSRTGDIMGVPVVAMCETPFYGYRGVLKRVTDICFTLGVLVFALPVMIVVAILIKLTSRGPAIFKQRRYGLDGEEIVVYKFRSMRVTEDGTQIRQATRDDDRITPIGKYLRKYSLDELPQLFNVLQGRMSLVGPRPHAVAHNEQYRKLIKGYMMRHKVLPGITGLAQVSGCRGETAELADMQARVNYDLDYLRHWSPALDFKIIVLTAVQLFRDSKAY